MGVITGPGLGEESICGVLSHSTRRKCISCLLLNLNLCLLALLPSEALCSGLQLATLPKSCLQTLGWSSNIQQQWLQPLATRQHLRRDTSHWCRLTTAEDRALAWPAVMPDRCVLLTSDSTVATLKRHHRLDCCLAAEASIVRVLLGV